MVPDGWRSTKLGKVFKNRRERGQSGLPTLSVTLKDGLVLRESLDRKTDTNLSPEDHLLVREGDIVYNMMRMWQGASGLASFDALVSPAYVVLKSTNDIDPVFTSYLLKSPRIIYLLWAYSYGLTSDRLRLYFADFSLVPVALPPVDEQRRIAHALAAWDLAIDKLSRRIANKELERQVFAARLFDQERRFPEFEGSAWENAPLAECCHRKGEYGANAAAIRFCADEPRYLRITDISDVGDLIESDAVSIRRSKAEGSFLRAGDIVFARSGATVGKAYLHRSSEELAYAGYLIKFRPRTELLDPEFLFQFVRSRQYWRWVHRSTRAGAQPNINAEEYGGLRVPLPSIAEQKKVSRVLRKFDQQLQALRKDRDLVVLQKTALMQQLLTGKLHLMDKDAAELSFTNRVIG